MFDIESYDITKKTYYELYNILIVNYLQTHLSYDKCVDDAFEYLETLNIVLSTEKPFRLFNYLRNSDAKYSFYVDYKNKKIIYEGLLSIKAIHEMSYKDVYINTSDLNDICEKYHLERKSERKIKIEKLLKNV